jgi:hypothetical protein
VGKHTLGTGNMKHLKTYKIFESILSEKLYHGNRKGDFPPQIKRFAGAIFLTSNIDFAKNFASLDEKDDFPDASVFEVKLKSDIKLCNPMDSEVMKELNLVAVIQKMIDSNYIDSVNGTKFVKVSNGMRGYNPDKDEEFDITNQEESVYHYLWRVKNGAWRVVECEPIINQIKSKKYDGFYVIERGSKNVAIFDESSIDKFNKII